MKNNAHRKYTEHSHINTYIHTWEQVMFEYIALRVGIQWSSGQLTQGEKLRKRAYIFAKIFVKRDCANPWGYNPSDSDPGQLEDGAIW